MLRSGHVLQQRRRKARRWAALEAVHSLHAASGLRSMPWKKCKGSHRTLSVQCCLIKGLADWPGLVVLARRATTVPKQRWMSRGQAQILTHSTMSMLWVPD